MGRTVFRNICGPRNILRSMPMEGLNLGPVGSPAAWEEAKYFLPIASD